MLMLDKCVTIKILYRNTVAQAELLQRKGVGIMITFFVLLFAFFALLVVLGR